MAASLVGGAWPIGPGGGQIQTLKEVKCDRNQGHANFLTPAEITREHLPPGYQNDPFVNIVKLKCADTVLLQIVQKSPDRPLNFGGAPDSPQKHGGSGTVFTADMQANQTCPDPNCSYDNNTQHQITGAFRVATTTATVYDDFEARHTNIWFFFDEEGYTCCIKGVGVKVVAVDYVNKVSIMECRSHCLFLFDKLQRIRFTKETFLRQLSPSLLFRTLPDHSIGELLPIMTCHPHGKSKRVIVGALRAMSKLGTDPGTQMAICNFTYAIPTCRGCNGASVALYNVVGYCVGFFIHVGFSTNLGRPTNDRDKTGLGWILEDYVPKRSNAISNEKQ